MGPPINGSLLTLEAIRRIAPAARKSASEQLLYLWQKHKNRTDTEALWGDEIEYNLVQLDDCESRATVLLSQEEVLHKWEEHTARAAKTRQEDMSHGILHPEGEMFTIESTPHVPYSGKITDLLDVESTMKRRRELILKFLLPNQHVVSMPVFPGLGMVGTTQQCTPPAPGNWQMPPSSHLIPPKGRSCYQLNNIIGRRRRRIESYIPVYQDQFTPQPFYDTAATMDIQIEHPPPVNMKEGHVYLDGIIGVGCCSVQCTFQSRNENEARWLHDQLIPLSPVMLVLTAATPIYKGLLVNKDTRWNRLVECTDDRTAAELDLMPPRMAWNCTYISQEKPVGVDGKIQMRPMDEAVMQDLMDGGMDEPLAGHFAAILSRDPLVLTQEEMDNVLPPNTKLFENYHTSVWPLVRFKLPADGDGPGWRNEFRPMEVQLTDFDNAAFAIFLYLVSRAISAFHLKFYIPIDNPRDSWDVAHNRDAVLQERLWFRRTGWSSDLYDQAAQVPQERYTDGKAEYGLMTAHEIINGEDEATESAFPGLVRIIYTYLDFEKVSPTEQLKLSPYLDLVSKRASGEVPTPARWMRDFVAQHEEYNGDSRVGEKICYDMMREIVS